jgi:hypothetical protein
MARTRIAAAVPARSLTTFEHEVRAMSEDDARMAMGEIYHRANARRGPRK